MSITESYSLNILIIVCICLASLAFVILVSYGIRKLITLFKIVTEKPFTMDEELRLNMLSSGFYVICGRQRIGKGALGTAVMDTDCTYHCEKRLALAQAEIDELNSIRQENPYNLHLPDFPYRSKNKMLLGPDRRPTYHMDVKQFALPNGQNNVQYLPPYTMIHAEEIDAYMNCRTWKKNEVEKANVIDAIKWIGHNDLTFIGDAQRLDRLDAGARALATDVWYILKKRDFTADDEELTIWQTMFRRQKTGIIRTEWTFLWIKNQLKEQAAELRSFGERIGLEEYVKKCKFNYYGNIYELYNSQSGKAYWYKGIQDFTVEIHPDDTLTRDAVDDYCERNARSAENGEAGQE